MEVKGSMGQRVIGSKGQWVKGSMGQRVQEQTDSAMDIQNTARTSIDAWKRSYEL